MKRAYDLRTLIGFMCALGIMGVVAVITYRGARDARDDGRLVAHTYEVLDTLQDVLVAIVDVETIVRGYVITGQETFLEPYDRTLRDVADRLQDVRTLTADNPRQQKRLAALEPIILAKLGFLADQITARRQSGDDAAAELVRTGTGKNLMDTVRSGLIAMQQDEETLLAERIARTDRSQIFAMIVIVVGNLAAFLFLANAIMVIYSENHRRERAEAMAIAERTRLDLIVSSVGEGVVAADAQGRFTLFNPMAESLIGAGATTTPRETWAQHYGVFQIDGTPCPPDEVPLVRTLRGESCQNAEIVVRNPNRPDGVILSVTGRPIRDGDDAVVGGVIVFSDITERKNHEDVIRRKNDELAQAYAELDRTRLQQLEMKDQLLSHVSHELRTPLTAASQFVDILRDGLAGELTAEQREYTEIVTRNLRQLHAMIGDLLDATRLESAKLTIVPQPMSLMAVATDVCRTLHSPAVEKQIVLENRIGNIPEVYADTNRVRQVFTNLLHNAIKFTQSGTITIDAAVVTDDPRLVEVTVADTGCGMDAEALTRIFTRLYQAGAPSSTNARQGLGLGLYICRELVTRQGGTIWVESTVGKGSIFHWTVPVLSQPEQLEKAS